MNRDRFQDLLDIRGSDLATWPDAERVAAERLVASDPGAAQAFEEARRLDRSIQRGLIAAAPETSRNDVASRILANLPKKLPQQAGQARKLSVQAVRKSPKPWTLFPAPGALLPRVAALSFAAALGIALGLFWAQNIMLDDRQVLIASEEAGTDVTSVIFQPGTAIGTF